VCDKCCTEKLSGGLDDDDDDEDDDEEDQLVLHGVVLVYVRTH